MAVCHRVAFVGHADLRQAAGFRELERVADNAVHALVGVQLLLNRYFVFRAGFEPPADADIESFGVLAEHDEVDVRGAAALERTEALVQQPYGPVVDVKVEFEARAEQDVARVAVVGHARIAERAHEHGVKFPEVVVAVRRQRHVRFEVMVRAHGSRSRSKRRPNRSPTAVRTLTDSAVTSLPIPSPGTTAMRICVLVVRASRRGGARSRSPPTHRRS